MISRLAQYLFVIIIGLVVFMSNDLAEPIKFGGFTFELEDRQILKDKTQPICHAIEDAGYIMPYGVIGDDLEISQKYWVLSVPLGPLLSIPRGLPHIFITVDQHIPADLNMLPNGVTQETVDHLAEDAKKICRIVQREAARQGIGPVAVFIGLMDVIVGLSIGYGRYNPFQPQGWELVSTSDCDKIVGRYDGKSIGMNPEGRTPDRCPSLYVPN